MLRHNGKDSYATPLLSFTRLCFVQLHIGNGDRTEWGQITDRIERHEILLSSNHKNYNF